MPLPVNRPASGSLRAPGCKRNGFSLVEVAIALAVMGLLLGSLMVPLAAQSDMRARRATDKALVEIREALIGYALVKGRLPCPAPATAATGTAAAGVEGRYERDCACSGASALASSNGTACSTPFVVGVVPWATLGLAETDAWGRRYTYSIDTQFGLDPGPATVGCFPSMPPVAAGFALCSPSHVEIRTVAGGPFAVSGNVPAVVVSHGRNGLGAYLLQGNQIKGAGGSPDELENANGDGVFVSNTNSDDQMVWVPPYVLMHRMVSAGMLP